MEEKILTIEEKMLQKVNKKKKRKRNRKIIKFVFLMSAIGLLGFYLISDISKVKSITVVNNVVYSDEEILEKAKIDYKSSYLLTLRFWTNYMLEKDPLIKNASLSKNLQGGFTITIEEEKIIGYVADSPNNVLIQGKGMVKVDNLNIQNISRLSGFNDQQLKMLDEAFSKVKVELLPMISEIIPHSESYNENMVKIIMNDGNRITSSYEGIYLINNYKKILPQLQGTHVCLFMDEYSGNIIKQANDCK